LFYFFFTFLKSPLIRRIGGARINKNGRFLLKIPEERGISLSDMPGVGIS